MWCLPQEWNEQTAMETRSGEMREHTRASEMRVEGEAPERGMLVF